MSKVEFLVGTTVVCFDTSAPYACSYNTRNLPNGAKVITAKAYDSLNNVGTSAPVNVITPPSGMASTALNTMFVSASRSSDGSAATGGSGGMLRSTVMVAPLDSGSAFHRGWVRSST